MRSLLTKLAKWSAGDALESHGVDIGGGKTGMLESASELLRTHPSYVNRFARLKEFSESEEYLRASQKIKRRLGLTRALIPVCRFCKAKKTVEQPFCPVCGMCQT